MNKDPYAILGVDRSATKDEIKKAFRKLAVKHHPDKGGDENLFKEILDAYNKLINKNKNDFWENIQFEDYQDFFRSPFGGGFGYYTWDDSFKNRKGADTHTTITISLADAFHGCIKDLNIGIRKISIKIPPGVNNNRKLKVVGLGQKGYTDESNGDLIITIQLEEDEKFSLDEYGLHTLVKISLLDAILGATKTIDVFGHSVKYTIPKCTQNGSSLRIREKGFTQFNSTERGDLYLSIFVELPTKLTEEQEKVFEQLKKLEENGDHIS